MFYDGWSIPYFGMLIMPIMMVLVPVTVVLVVIVLVRSFRIVDRRRGGDSPIPLQQRNALDTLNERFTRGKIDGAEYEEKRRIISKV
jgi:uncharacterized membrane protein